MTPVLLLAALALPGCTDDAPDPGGFDTVAPSDTESDTGAVAFDCGVIPPGPTPSGDAWTEAASQPPAGGLFTLLQDPLEDVLYAGSHNAGLWRSDDQGQSWEWLHVEITHTMSDMLVPAGHAGELLRSSGGTLHQSFDGGRSWTPLALGALLPDAPAQLVLALGGAGYDGDRVYALTSDGTLHRSIDGAATFAEVGSVAVRPDPDDLNHLRYLGWRLLGDQVEGDPLVLATQQGLWRSVDGGDAWTLVRDGDHTGATLVRDPLDTAHLVLGGAGGLLLQSWDNGESWETQTLDQDVTGAGFSRDGATLWLVGDAHLWTSVDGGRTLEDQPVAFQDPRAVHQTDAGRLLVADDNGMSATDDAGATWFDAAAGMADLGMAVLTAHPACPNGLITASRCSGGLFTSDDWGESWDHAEGHFHYVMAVHHDPSDPDHLWTISDDALYESVDGGGSWALRWTKYHAHGFAIHPTAPGTLLMGSVGSGEFADTDGWVYRSEDGGETWKDSGGGLPDNEASMHALQYWPGNPEVVLLGTYKVGDVSHQRGEGIGLWRSTDGGRYWRQTDLDVADVAWLTEAPGGVVAATDDGLWRSTDTGETWTRLEGPEGFLLSVDFQGDVGVTVGRDGGTWRTADGGERWSRLDAGTFWDPSTWLSTVVITADATVAYLTIYNVGVYQLGLQ